MFSRGIGIIALVLLLAVSASVGLASQTDWNTQLKAYFESVGGPPQDLSAFLGVKPGATDGWDVGIDNKKPGEPMGEYVYTWFNRPTWQQGPIAGDYRGEIGEGETKTWGTGMLDTFNVKLNIAQAGSGVFDSCGWGIEYPVADAVYLTWTLGVGAGMEPPADYVFTLQYVGGINAKPAGTGAPGVSVPTMNQTWDMKAISDIAIPLWHKDFQPPNAACDQFAAADTAKFKIIIENPDGPNQPPTCNITYTPAEPTTDDLITFNANASDPDGTVVAWDWDFGDGGAETRRRISMSRRIRTRWPVR